VTVDGVIACEEHAVMRMFLSVSLPIVVTPLLQAQLDLRQIKLNELLSVVQLYKALGGGWQS
jgi:hypothetical protein